MIKFISHEYFYEDEYTKEICYLSIDDKFRFAYARKAKKDGSLFWSPFSTSVKINGEKKFRHAIEWDSSFLAKDILAFLEARSWQAGDHISTVFEPQPISPPKNESKYQQVNFLDECPF